MFQSLSPIPDFTWFIDGIREKLEPDTFQIKSPPFSWREYPVQAQARLVANEAGQVRVSMDLRPTAPATALHFPLLPSVLYVLRDRSESGQSRHVVRPSAHPFGRQCGSYRDMYGETLVHKSRLTESASVYNVANSIYIVFFVEKPAAVERLFSRDGSLHMRLPGYRRLRQLEERDSLVNNECPYIYTGQPGYRVRVNFYLIGFCGGESVISVSVNFLKGEFDEELSVNFAHRTTITVYNPRHQERFVTATVERNIDAQSTAYSFVVCTHQFVDEMLGTDDELCFFLTITPLTLPEKVVEKRGIEALEEGESKKEEIAGV